MKKAALFGGGLLIAIGLILAGFSYLQYTDGSFESAARLEVARSRLLPADGPAIHPSQQAPVDSEVSREQVDQIVRSKMLFRFGSSGGAVVLGVLLLLVGVRKTTVPAPTN